MRSLENLPRTALWRTESNALEESSAITMTYGLDSSGAEMVWKSAQVVEPLGWEAK